jgi:hypothetical protein
MAETLCGSGRSAPSARPRRGHAQKSHLMIYDALAHLPIFGAKPGKLWIVTAFVIKVLGANDPCGTTLEGQHASTGREGKHRRSCVWGRTELARQLGLASPSGRNLRHQILGLHHGDELLPG